MNVPQSAGMITGTSGHTLPIGMKLGHLELGERRKVGGVREGERGKEMARWKGEKREKGGKEGEGGRRGREGGRGVLPFHSCAGAPGRPLAAAQWVQKVVRPISLLGS